MAPSRSQLVDQALASIPTLIPLDLQNHVRRAASKLRPKPTQMAVPFSASLGSSVRCAEALFCLAVGGETKKGKDEIIQFHVRENLGAFGGPFLGPLCSPKIGGDVILYLGFLFW